MTNLLVEKEADRVVAPGRAGGQATATTAWSSPTTSSTSSSGCRRHYFEQRRARQGGGREGEGRDHPGRLPDRLQQRPAQQRRRTSPRGCRSRAPRSSSGGARPSSSPTPAPKLAQRRPGGDQGRRLRRLRLPGRPRQGHLRRPRGRPRRQGLLPDAGPRRDAGLPPDPDGEGPPARLLPALVLGEDARPRPRPAPSA